MVKETKKLFHSGEFPQQRGHVVEFKGHISSGGGGVSLLWMEAWFFCT